MDTKKGEIWHFHSGWSHYRSDLTIASQSNTSKYCTYIHIIGTVLVQWNLRMWTPFGTQHFVCCREVVLFQRYRVCIQRYIWFVLCLEVCPLSECPLSEVSLQVGHFIMRPCNQAFCIFFPTTTIYHQVGTLCVCGC